MRPLKLTMSAFGSYADTQEIDFTALGAGGLYLITGETGSGKTTIFDAISYALFGKASGRARDNYKMLRSDYVEGRVKTFVALDFSAGNDAYGITRAITPHIARKTGEAYYTDSVVLTLPDKTTLTRENEVAAKMAEIIGLDREQFAQIVMIAQNDFLRFLQSGTEERVKILRRIFGTGLLKNFQEALKARSKAASDELALCRRDFERYGVDPYKRERQFAEWEAQIEEDKAALAQADEKLGAYGELSKELAAQKAVAEELSKKFAAFDAVRSALSRHSAQSGQMRQLETRRARAETALRRVKPLAEKADETQRFFAAAHDDLSEAKEREKTALAELEAARRSLASLPPLEEKRAAAAALQRECEQAEGKFVRLKELNADCRDIAAKQAALAALQKELVKAQDKIALLPALDDAQSAFRALGEECEKAKTLCAELTSLHGDFAAIVKMQGDLTALHGEFEKLDGEFKAADGEHKAVEEAFLRGQAGLLAQALEDGRPCPVCGSTEHPSPASSAGRNVTESDLKKAKNEAEKVRGQREETANACSIAKTRIKILSDRFLSDLQKVVPAASMDAAGTLLADSLRAAESAQANLAKKMAADERTLSVLIKQLADAREKCGELVPKCAEMKSAIDTRRQRFLADASEFIPSAEWEGAGEKLAALLASEQKAADELAVREKAAADALTGLAQKQQAAAERNFDAEKANKAALILVAERARRAEEQGEFRDKAAYAYAAALKACDFASAAQYQNALWPEDELAAAAKQLFAYEKEGELLQADSARLTAETADKEKPDLEKLFSQAEAANAEAVKLRGERDALKSRLGQTEEALKQLRRSEKLYAQLEKRYAAVKQLSDAANGRLDFETYAQTAYFGRVLRAANLRLKLMSQNRYVLRRKEDSGDSRRRSGLDLEVFDSYTGKARSANSLSGGESFMASLSLALGLSDVVQQSAGGIRLDAMFIDEGFGSLDSDVLELAVRTLSDMTSNGRSIGIISHVAELRERIDKQIRVEKTPAGSRVKISL